MPERAVKESLFSLKQAIENTKESKWKEFGEAVKRWKDKEDVVDAKCKVNLLFCLFFFLFSLYSYLLWDMLLFLNLCLRLE